MSKKRKRQAKKSPGTPPRSESAEPQVDQTPQPVPHAGNTQTLRRWWSIVASEPIALGVALLVLLRPWRDGLTYPVFNLYYVGLIVAMAALVSVRLLLRREHVRHPAPVLLLGGYVVIAVLGAFDTVQLDATWRALVIWSGHFLLFLVCTNGLATKRALGIVFGATVLSLTLSGAWALIHFYEVLPQLREYLAGDPERIRTFFGGPQNDALWSRLMMNRAFGTSLFPNSLAAIMILGIPLCIGALRPSIHRLRSALRQARSGDAPVPSKSEREAQLVGSALIGLGACVGMLLAVYLADLLMSEYVQQGTPLFSTAAAKIFAYAVLPLGTAAVSVIVCRVWGFAVYWPGVFGAISGIGLCVQLYALILTYSRGGVLALIGALTVAGVLFAMGEGGALAQRYRRLAERIALVLVTCSIAFGGLHAHAQTLEEMGIDTVGPLGNEPIVPPQELDPADLVLEAEGMDVTTKDIRDVNTIELRISYWRVGVLMVMDNFFSGVGLGNFGTAYPSYQYLGAGTSQMAHNDYLQAFVETGAFGFLAFYGFGFYLALWGASRVVSEKDKIERWTRAGMYAAVLAFLLHSIVDFDFQNPMTATFFFVIAGVFCAWCSPPKEAKRDIEAPTRARSLLRRPLAAVLVIVVLVTTAGSIRLYLFELALTKAPTVAQRLWNVGDRRRLNRAADEATWILLQLGDRVIPNNPPWRYVNQIAELIPDRRTLETFGPIYDRDSNADSPTQARRLPTDEPASKYARAYITNPRLAKRAAREASEVRLEQLKIWDESYPHDPELAGLIANWYAILYEAARTPADADRFSRLALEWAQRLVDRSPVQSMPHSILAQMYWNRANYVGITPAGPTQALTLFEKGLEERRLARDLHSVQALYWEHYWRSLDKLGDALIQNGRTDRGAKMKLEAKQAKERAELLALTERWKLDLLLR